VEFKLHQEFMLDEHVKMVLEFMQGRIPASKLIGTAEKLPQIAKLLWDRYPQEPVNVASLASAKTDQAHRSPKASTESVLAQ
jgi:hypothetical protein